MAEQLLQMKDKAQDARSDIAWLLQDPTPEQRLMLERGDKTLESFIKDDYPQILKAFSV
jgi:hypothetical protein